MNSRVLIFFATLFLVLVSTTALFFWTKGYRLDREGKKVEKVGMIQIKSVPDGARVFLDGKLTSVTNTNLSSLKGGPHHLRVEKEGFAAWEKTVPVREELVTVVDIVLVPLSVELKPLTTAGVISPILAASRDKIYFLAKVVGADEKNPKAGLWALDLTGSVFNLFKGGPSLLLPDQKNLAFSAAESMEMAPEGNQLLVKMNEKGYYLIDLTNPTAAPVATDSATPSRRDWKANEMEKKRQLAEKFKLPFDLATAAVDPQAAWSPDEKKFLYRKKNEKGDSWQYSVRNLTDPPGVGEQDEYRVARVSLNSPTRFSWYPDSKRLLTAECEKFEKEKCVSGSIHLLDFDGTNNVQVYSGSMSSDEIFATPDGSKIIILVTFNQSSPPNLYAISLR